MDIEKDALLQELERCVLEMEDETVADAAAEYAGAGHDIYDGLTAGLSEGMRKAGALYEQQEYFVPELLLCSDALYRGMEVLKPHLATEHEEARAAVVIGVVEGDTHDIGKNIVKTMLETAGFAVHDLGRDVKCERFVAAVREHNAQLLCMSTMMSDTMPNMERVIEQLKAAGLREQVRVMIGGGPVSKAFADQIGADAFTASAADAVAYAEQCCKERK